jgi:quinol monooxygenase YgiN
MKEVFIVGEMEVAPENVEVVEDILSELRENTRQEAG